jgi:atypical dual specificity phosphatase
MQYTNFDWIDDQLAVGGLVSEPEDLPFDAILSMTPEAPTTVRPLVTEGNVEYRWFSIIDGYSHEEHDEIVNRYDRAVEQLDVWVRDGKRVLVHCHAGVSRSATAVVWYLVKYRGMSWDEAHALVRRGRQKARPNIRFEIPLRMSMGETFTDEQLWEMATAYCNRILEDEGVVVPPQEIMDDLERQGTLERLRSLPAAG